CRREVGFDLPRFRIEQHQATLVVGDEDPSALVDLEAVRPAVVLRDKLPFAFRVDAEDAPEGDVDAPQMAVAVEGGAFEKAVDRRAAAVGIGPRGAPLLAELRRERRERPGFDAFYVLERVEQGSLARGGEA